MSDHDHECRDCGYSIPCADPCTWEGGNADCLNPVHDGE